MRSGIALALITILMESSLPPVIADQTAHVRHLIQVAYDKQDAAYTRRDIEGVVACYAPSWTSGGGPVSVAEDQTNIRSALVTFFDMRGSITEVQKIQSLTLRADQAVALVTETRTVGPSVTDGYAVSALVQVISNRDTWQFIGHRWLMTRHFGVSSYIKQQPHIGVRR